MNVKFRGFLLAALLAAPTWLLAQVPMLGTTIEKEFSVTDVPEKWKNESAVIIGQKTEYLFARVFSGKTSTVVRIHEYVHKRIRLQDKNSLEKFSTFYYVTMGKDGKAEYKVIKKNGKEITIDMASALEEEKDVPAIYRPIFFKMNIKSMKIAIPDLEVGDIIDYTIKSTFDWDMKESSLRLLFSPFPTVIQLYSSSINLSWPME